MNDDMKITAADLHNTDDMRVHDMADDILEERANQFRCSLTGAPYGAVNHNEIRIFLAGQLRQSPSLTNDELRDRWDLNLLNMCSRPSPAIRNCNQLTLAALREYGNGETRLAVYFLSRLMFPPSKLKGGFYTTTETAINRMQFAAAVYDRLAQVEVSRELKEAVEYLAACDSFFSLSQWINAPGHIISKAKMTKIVTECPVTSSLFADPHDFAEQVTAPDVLAIAKTLLKALLTFADKAVSQNATANKFSRCILTAQAEAIPVPSPEATPKEAVTRRHSLVTRDESEMPDNAPTWYKAFTSKKPQVKIAHSVTHGKGVVMRGEPKAKAKTEPKTPKGKRARAFARAAAKIDFKL